MNLKFAPIYRDHIWVPILEKAWAKVMGHYSNINSWSSVNAIRVLTGAPVFEYATSAFATGALVFADIELALSKNYIITAKTKSTASSLSTTLTNSKEFAII